MSINQDEALCSVGWPVTTGLGSAGLEARQSCVCVWGGRLPVLVIQTATSCEVLVWLPPSPPLQNEETGNFLSEECY